MCIQLAGDPFFLRNSAIKLEDVFAVALVLLDEGQIPKEDRQQASDEEEKNHHPGEFVPNPKVDVHCNELSTRRRQTERRNCKMWRLPLPSESAISGVYVGRSQSGAATSGQRLGTNRCTANLPTPHPSPVPVKGGGRRTPESAKERVLTRGTADHDGAHHHYVR